MSEKDLSKNIIDNIRATEAVSGYAANSDLDRMNAKHGMHMAFLTNVYEFWTHKTVLMIIAAVLVFANLMTRYILVLDSSNEVAKAINKDTATAISYFVTAVASWFVTKNLEGKP